MNQIIRLPVIELNWSDFTPVGTVKNSDLPAKAGVYEVINEKSETLHIGRASNLKARVMQAFIKDNSPHSTRERMVKNGVDINKLKIRWAQTDWPNAVEEYLHKEYKRKHSSLPKYTKNT